MYRCTGQSAGGLGDRESEKDGGVDGSTINGLRWTSNNPPKPRTLPSGHSQPVMTPSGESPACIPEARVTVPRGGRPHAVKSEGRPLVGLLLFPGDRLRGGRGTTPLSNKMRSRTRTDLQWGCSVTQVLIYSSPPGSPPPPLQVYGIGCSASDTWLKWTITGLWVLTVTHVPKFLTDLWITTLWTGLSWQSSCKQACISLEKSFWMTST